MMLMASCPTGASSCGSRDPHGTDGMILRPATPAYRAGSSTKAMERGGMILRFADPAHRPGSCTAAGTMERAA